MCPLWQGFFTHKSSLTKHMMRHIREKSYQCPQCKKSFSRKGHITCQITTHTGERLYQCSECDKCFALKGKLQYHMRAHFGEKPYQCSQCDKVFTHKSQSHAINQIFWFYGISGFSQISEKMWIFFFLAEGQKNLWRGGGCVRE